jgi:ribonuclease HI
MTKRASNSRRAARSARHVVAFTDGACSGNPGPGGWGVLLKSKGRCWELKGGAPHTTNNRLELISAIAALEVLKRPAVVEIHSDSRYVCHGITSWIIGWKQNGWRTRAGGPVKNADLWRRLEAATKRHRVTWHWVRGHNGTLDNERADQLARQGMRPYERVHRE